MFRVSFTGYRPAKLPFYGDDDPACIELKERLANQIERLILDGADEFYSGMALGVDMWCAEAVIALREKYPQIRLIAFVPCKGQELRWNASEQARYRDILSRCQQVMCFSPVYTSDCMHKRNRALVDICDVLIAVFDGKSGGTKYTVDYAKKKNRSVIEISPM